MVKLFKTALECRYVNAPLTRAKAERQHHTYLAKAKDLQHDAIMMMTQCLSAESDLLSQLVTENGVLVRKIGPQYELSTRLGAAAEACKEYAREIYRALPSLPKRDRDVRARLVALMISHKSQALFGSPLYGVTAKIASVVLGRQIDPGTVRFWRTSHPVVKAHKLDSVVKPQKFVP
jgi:hypothetical protein